MTPSIHLVQLRVSGWKGIKDEACIEFGDRSWLIHGANEAGKSSLFSALRFALFEHSAKGGAYSDGWVNNDSTQAEVEVALKISGAPYTIVKIRDHKKKGTTRLYDGIGTDRRERTVKNKDADLEILQLIGASARKGRDSEVPSSWGILAWLLAPQSINTVHDAREHGTGALGLGSAISPEFQRLQEHIARFASDNFGKSGAPLRASELCQRQEAVDQLRADAKALAAQRAAYSDELQKVTRLERTEPERQAALQDAERAYDQRRESGVDFATDEANVKTLAKSVELAESKASIAARAVDALSELNKEVAEATEAVRKRDRAVGKVEDRATKAASNLARVEQQIAAATEQRERNHATIEAHSQAIARLEQQARRAAITAQLTEIDAVERDLAELGGAILSEGQIDERVQLASDLAQAESLLDNLAKERSVTVTLTGDLDATWRRDGEAAEPTEALTFASDLQIQAEQFTLRMQVDRAGATGDWVETRRALAEQVAALGYDDAEALRAAMKRERERTRTHAELCAKQARLGDKAQLRSEAATLDATLQGMAGPKGAAQGPDGQGSDHQPPDGQAPDDQATDGQAPDGQGVADITTLKEEVAEARADNRELLQRLEALGKKRTEVKRERLAQTTALEEARAQHLSAVELLKTATTRRDKELASAGLLAARERTHEAAAEQLQAAKQALSDAQAQLETNKGAHQDELNRLRRVRNQARKDLRDCEADIQVAKRTAEELGGQDLQAQEIALRQALQAAELALDRERRRSEAKRRLAARLADFMVETTEVETAPIKDRVQAWLRVITQGHWRAIDMDSHLEVTRLEGSPPTIDGETMGSAGLRQVIHALTRLAVAVKIHEDGAKESSTYPPVAIVMDESLSHVDTGRVGRLMRVFNDQIEAGRVQVMALSHRQDEFLNLRARSYDISRREAYDLDGD